MHPDSSTPSTTEETTKEIPYGYCQCGCGRKTTVSRRSNKYYGYVRGEPRRYVHGHNRAGKQLVIIPPPNPDGMCLCGCGEPTPIANKTDTAAFQLKGHPIRYVMGHSTRLSPAEYIEDDRGYETPCWIWQRSIDRNGYGRVGNTKAHIQMYERFRGKVPSGLQLDHLCRQRSCCNPDHVELVTNQVNTQRGSQARLNPDKVRQIRRLQGKVSIREIAERLGVEKKTVWCVIAGRTWTNVDSAVPTGGMTQIRDPEGIGWIEVTVMEMEEPV